MNIVLDECSGKQCIGCRHCRKLNSARAERATKCTFRPRWGHRAPSCPSAQRSFTGPIAEEWPFAPLETALERHSSSHLATQPSALQPLKVACRVALDLRVCTRKLSPLRHSGLFTTPPSTILVLLNLAICSFPDLQNERAAHHGYPICIFDARLRAKHR